MAFDTLDCPFKMALKIGALQNPYFEACSECVTSDEVGLGQKEQKQNKTN